MGRLGGQGPSGFLNPDRRTEKDRLRRNEEAYERALGRMLMRAGFLEYLIQSLAGDVLRLDSEQVRIVTARMPFSGLCDMTDRLLSTWSPHPVQAKVRAVLRNAVKAMSDRNDMAHATWASWDKSEHHIRWARRDSVGREVPISEIDDLTEKLNGLISDVMEATSHLSQARRAGEIIPGARG